MSSVNIPYGYHFLKSRKFTYFETIHKCTSETVEKSEIPKVHIEFLAF